MWQESSHNCIKYILDALPIIIHPWNLVGVGSGWRDVAAFYSDTFTVSTCFSRFNNFDVLLIHKIPFLHSFLKKNVILKKLTGNQRLVK